MEPSAVPPVPHPGRSVPPGLVLPITVAAPRRWEHRWSVAALCAALAVLCALGAAWAVVAGAGERIKALAIARDVRPGQPVTAADLTVVSVAPDDALFPVPAARQADVVGRRAAVGLRKGGLLTPNQLAGGTGLGDDRQQVGVEVEQGRAPRDALLPGDEVLAVTLPAPGDKASGDKARGADERPPSVRATVVSVSPPDAAGTEVVNLAVASADGPLLATRAAQGRIALVRQPRSR